MFGSGSSGAENSAPPPSSTRYFAVTSFNDMPPQVFEGAEKATAVAIERAKLNPGEIVAVYALCELAAYRLPTEPELITPQPMESR